MPDGPVPPHRQLRYACGQLRAARATLADLPDDDRLEAAEEVLEHLTDQTGLLASHVEQQWPARAREPGQATLEEDADAG